MEYDAAGGAVDIKMNIGNSTECVLCSVQVEKVDFVVCWSNIRWQCLVCRGVWERWSGSHIPNAGNIPDAGNIPNAGFIPGYRM